MTIQRSCFSQIADIAQLTDMFSKNNNRYKHLSHLFKHITLSKYKMGMKTSDKPITKHLSSAFVEAKNALIHGRAGCFPQGTDESIP